MHKIVLASELSSVHHFIMCDSVLNSVEYLNVLLVTSPVFKRMLQTDFKESTECEVTITDFSYEIIMEMVVFMYTGEATNIDTKAIDLLKIADKVIEQSFGPFKRSAF